MALPSSTQADYKISSAQDYVSLIAQETINILGNKAVSYTHLTLPTKA